METPKITEIEILAVAQGKADAETEARVLRAVELDPKFASGLAIWRESLPAARAELLDARAATDRIAHQVRERGGQAQSSPGVDQPGQGSFWDRVLPDGWRLASALSVATLTLILAGTWALEHRTERQVATNLEILQNPKEPVLDSLSETIREAPRGGIVLVHSGRIAEAIRIDKPVRLERNAAAL